MYYKGIELKKSGADQHKIERIQKAQDSFSKQVADIFYMFKHVLKDPIVIFDQSSMEEDVRGIDARLTTVSLNTYTVAMRFGNRFFGEDVAYGLALRDRLSGPMPEQSEYQRFMRGETSADLFIAMRQYTPSGDYCTVVIDMRKLDVDTRRELPVISRSGVFIDGSIRNQIVNLDVVSRCPLAVHLNMHPGREEDWTASGYVKRLQTEAVGEVMRRLEKSSEYASYRERLEQVAREHYPHRIEGRTIQFRVALEGTHGR